MGQPLTSITELAITPDNADFMHVVDVSDTTDSLEGTSKKVTVANLLAGATVSDASTTVKGKVELATDAETVTGTDSVRAITPSNYKNAFDETLPAVTNASTTKATPVDADELPLVDSAASNVLKKLTWANIKATLLTWLRLSTTIIPSNLSEGQMLNGRIAVTDSGSGIVVAIKTFAGTDPSSTDPVYVVVNGVVRTISAPLSVTVADGTNTMNLGSSELATKEADLFAHLFWKAADSSIVLGFARITGSLYSEFSGTATNEKYVAVSATPASTDVAVVIGRFAATLSAGAGYTWSVPTYTAANLIQRPIYETRWLSWQPAYSGAGAMTWTSVTTTTAKYKVLGGNVFLELDATGTVGGTLNVALYTTLPFTFLDIALGIGAVDGAQNAGFGRLNASNSLECYKYNSANWTAGASRGVRYNTFGEIN